jgi:photosystem II stability/assembly factor-like uncharacterized protein
VLAAGAACVPVVEDPARLAPAAPPANPKIPNPWFLQQRRDESGAIPPLARARAVEQVRRSGAIAGGGAWVQVGPVNVGGRISALAVDPNDANRIWLGAAEGGIFLSENGGATWAAAYPGQTALSIGSIATHPTDSDVVYVGTGEEAGGGFSYDGEGVLRTTDGGNTWTNLGLAETRRIGRVAIDPLDPDRIFVAAVGGLHNLDDHRGVYRSTDAGASWQKVLFIQNDTGAVDVAIDPQNPQRVFAAIWQRYRGDHQSYYGGAASGIYRSTDGGNVWTQLTSGLPSGVDVGRIGLAIARSDPQFVYAVIVRASGSLDGIYRSTNGGTSWTKLATPGFATYGYYFGQIRVHPMNPQTVYALDVALWRSTNGGTSFQQIGGSMHVDHHALEVGPGNRLLVGNDGGFYRSDNGTTFVHNLTLPITQFYDLCVDPDDADRRFGGTQDNGTLRTESAGDDDWESVLGGDGMHCAIDAVDSQRMYAEAQWGDIYRSTNGGDSFSSATSGIAGGDRRNWVTPIAADPSVSGRVYTGTQRMYRSNNWAQSWVAISDDLTDHEHVEAGEDHGQEPIQGTITAIGVSPLDSDIVWAGTDDGNVWVSDDAGSSWTEVDPPGPGYWVTGLAPDPFDADAVWLTHTGYRLNDTLPYVRYSPDLGQTWLDLDAGLPQIPLNDVVADPDQQGRVFVASDIGVFHSEDGGASWVLLADGLPHVVVLDLVLHAGARTLFAGTHGRSMFSFDLILLAPVDTDGDGVDNPDDCAPLDPGAFALPAEVPLLLLDRATNGAAELSWSDAAGTAGSDTVYDVVSGAIAHLKLPFNPGPVVVGCGVEETTISDTTQPLPGAGRYYLVRAVNVCGKGTWGADSSGEEHQFAACP